MLSASVDGLWREMVNANHAVDALSGKRAVPISTVLGEWRARSLLSQSMDRDGGVCRS